MKKQYFFALGLMMAGMAASAQNQILNGGFEDWTGANPVNFTEVGTSPIYNDLITKETTIVKSGSNSAKQQSKPQGTTQYLEYSNLIPVTAGHSYTISYWYLDNDNNASTRPWCTWLTDTGTLTNDTAQAQIRENDYSTNSSSWVQKTLTATAPIGATKIRFQVRTYHQDGNDGGFIYFDDLSFVDNSTAGINDNLITGLKMFPNPLNGNVLTITSDANATKKITVFDVLGKQVINTTTNNGTINTSNLTSGVYIVKITEEGKTATKKLVVQ